MSRRLTIILVDVGRPGEPPVEVRLRQLLKIALRAFSFRCESCANTSLATPIEPSAHPKRARRRTIVQERSV